MNSEISHINNIFILSDEKTRMVSPENVYGEKGKGAMAEVSSEPQPEVEHIGQKWEKSTAARELGKGWKVRPCITLPPRSTTTIMDVKGPGIIQHMWFTYKKDFHRELILRIYWDGEDRPSLEVPLDDFFLNGWNTRPNIPALPININPAGGFNCFLPMPFKNHVKITVENLAGKRRGGFFYTITYTLKPIPKNSAYLHAQFRVARPVSYQTPYNIVDGVKGNGKYVGTYLAWQQNKNGWWGEGEVKFYLDGDFKFPTICYTGVEDYLGGAWSFGKNFTAPYMGYPEGNTNRKAGNRHGLYRFHIKDPIRFSRDLKVTVQVLGWQPGRKYRPLEDNISSVAYWYQTEPHSNFPDLPSSEELKLKDE